MENSDPSQCSKSHTRTPLSIRTHQLDDEIYLDSDEDLFASESHPTCADEEIVPSGLGNLLGGPMPSNLSWTSSMASPLTGNVTYTNLNTEERKTLLPNQDSVTVKPRALFSPDPNDTVGCQSLNISSDLDLSHTKFGKTPGRNVSCIPRKFCKALCENNSVSDEEVQLITVSRPGSEVLDALCCSSLKQQNAKKNNDSFGNPGFHQRRVESPVLSSSNHMTEISSLKRVFERDTDDPFAEYDAVCQSPCDNSTKSHIHGDVTPYSLKKKNHQNESISITSTPNGNSLQSDEISFKDACEVAEVEALHLSPLNVNSEDHGGVLKCKRIIFTPSEKVLSKHDTLKLAGGSNLQGAAMEIDTENEFSIPDDSLMEHLANLNACSASSPKAKVLAIKNSHNARNFCYSTSESDPKHCFPEQLKAPLKEILTAASELESVLKLKQDTNILSSSTEFIAFSRLKESTVVQPFKITNISDQVGQSSCSNSEFSSKSAELVNSPSTSRFPLASKRKIFDVEDSLGTGGCKKLKGPSNSFSEESKLTSESIIDRPSTKDSDRETSVVEKSEESLTKIFPVTLSSCNSSKMEIPHEENRFDPSLHLSNACKNDSSSTIPKLEGFSTASGKAVSISIEAYQKAQNIFDNFNKNGEKMAALSDLNEEGEKREELPNLNKDSFFTSNTTFNDIQRGFEDSNAHKVSTSKDMTGFSTASGKSVLVSNAALLKAQMIFNSLEKDGKTFSETVGGVSSPSDQSQSISAVTDMKGFSTASGKSVSVSNATLLKTQKMFENSEKGERKTVVSTNAFLTPSGQLVTGLDSPVTKERAFKKSNLPQKNLVGFSTASGKSVPVSNAALLKAQKIMEDLDDAEKKSSVSMNGFSVLSGQSASVPNSTIENLQRGFENSDSSKESMVGFSTASGKSVSVSNVALQKAQIMFENLNAVENKSFSKMEESLISVSPSVSTSNATLSNVEKRLKDSDLQEQSTCVDMAGFSTASGKSLLVSNTALLKAQRIFDSLNGDKRETTDGSDAFLNLSDASNAAVKKVKKSFGDSSRLEENIIVEANESSTICSRFIPVSYSPHVKVKKDFNRLNQDENVLDKGNVPACSSLAVCKDVSNKNGDENGIELTHKYSNGRTSHLKHDSKGSNKDDPRRTQSVQNSTPLFVDDGFFNDSESMNAISNVMASICTSPSLVSDRTTVLQPIIVSETEDISTLDERTSPILVGSGSGRRSRKGRLSLLSSRRSSSPLISSLSENKTGNAAMIIRTCSSSRKVEMTESCRPSSSVDFCHGDFSSSEAEAFCKESSILQNQPSFHEQSSSNQTLSGICQKSKADCKEVFDKETAHLSQNLPNAVPSSSLVSSVRERSNLKSTDSSVSFQHCSDMTSNQTALPISSLNVSEVKLRHLTPNIYSFAEGPSDEQPVNGRLLRPEVAELRKRAAKEQKEFVDSFKDKGNGLHQRVGSLLSQKLSCKGEKLSWVEMVDGAHPGRFSSKELLNYGVPENVCNITTSNATSFRFSAWDYYSADVCRENASGIPLGDGALLVLDSLGGAGFSEVERAFLASPGVDPSLVPTGWVMNHYRLIVWKLAAMEQSFPQKFAKRCLTPNVLMQQLKYRYDREIDRCERPALRRILERDDSASKCLVLCVSNIIKKKNNKGRQDIELEVTDGWYCVVASIDSEMQCFISQCKVEIGTKLITHSAELLNCQEGSSPLEVQPDVRLRLSSNSTRRVRWFTKLGFHSRPGPINVNLHSVLSSGGVVSSLTAHVARVYPIVYMEKKEDKTVWRSERVELREAAVCAQQRQQFAEKALSQIRAEVHKQQNVKNQCSIKPSPHQIASLSSGEELLALLESAPDPDTVQCMMTDEQSKLVADYRRAKEELICREMESQLQKRLKESSTLERNITPVLKVRLFDVRNNGHFVTAILSVWRPSEDVRLMFKEGYKITVMGSVAHGYRYGEMQLQSNRSTCYKMLGISELLMNKLRVVSPLSDLFLQSFVPNFGELDIVGVVIRIGPLPKTAENSSFYQTVYLGDNHHNLIGISFWGGIKDFAFDDIIVCHAFVAASNLQWRGSPVMRPIPYVFANEQTTVTTNSRLPHLQLAMQELRQSIPSDMKTFLKLCQEKLDHLLSQRNSPAGPSVKSSCADTIERTHSVTAAAGSNLKTDIQIPKMDGHKVPLSLESSPLIEKRLAKLDMYGEPPPLSPIVLGKPSKTLCRTFQTPRRISNSSIGSSSDKNK